MSPNILVHEMTSIYDGFSGHLKNGTQRKNRWTSANNDGAEETGKDNTQSHSIYRGTWWVVTVSRKIQCMFSSIVLHLLGKWKICRTHRERWQHLIMERKEEFLNILTFHNRYKVMEKANRIFLHISHIATPFLPKIAVLNLELSRIINKIEIQFIRAP